MTHAQPNETIRSDGIRLWLFILIGIVIEQSTSNVKYVAILLLSMGVTAVASHKFRTNLHDYTKRSVIPCIMLGVLFSAASQSVVKPSNLTSETGVVARVVDVLGPDESRSLVAELSSGTRLHTPMQRGDAHTKIGQMVWITGPFRRLSPPKNFQDSSLTARWRSSGTIHRFKTSASTERQHGIREMINRRLERTFPPSLLGVAKALVLGDKSDLEPALHDRFSDVGANHLLAVSGLHVIGLAMGIMSILQFVLCRLTSRNTMPISIIGTGLVGLIVLSISNYPVGGVRALLMFGVVALGRLTGRQTDAIHVLYFVASIMALYTPNCWRTIGFQLSFAAVWGILNRSANTSQFMNIWSASFWSSVTTWPICVYYFGSLALWSPVTNLLLVPYTTVLLIPILWLGVLCYPINELPLELSIHICGFFLSLVGEMCDLGIRATYLGTNAAVPLTLCMLGIWLWTQTRMVACILISISLWPLTNLSMDEVHFLAVGQGDATLIKSEGKAMLVDVGPHAQRHRLIQILRKLGIKKLDIVLLTHNHPDHYGAIETLMNRMPVHTVIWNNRPLPTTAMGALRTRSQRRGSDWLPASRQVIGIGQFELELYPPENDMDLSENDASIAVLIRHPKAKILLTGDLEQRGETRLLSNKIGRVDVFQAGHHGSKTSNGYPLLASIEPSDVVFSIGRYNRFQFPHQEVVHRIRRFGARMWRTDRDGRIWLNLSHKASMQALGQAPISLRSHNAQ